MSLAVVPRWNDGVYVWPVVPRWNDGVYVYHDHRGTLT